MAEAGLNLKFRFVKLNPKNRHARAHRSYSITKAPSAHQVSQILLRSKDTFLSGSSRLARIVRARRFALLAVIVPVIVRAIPEILAGPWPLGFDTVLNYAPFVKSVETQGLGTAFLDFFSLHHQAPLMHSLLGIAAVSTMASPFAITKAAAPVLFGFLGFSLYHFARRGLRWDPKKSLTLVILTTLYFISLRFSWDMYKNVLGYAFFLLALACLDSRGNTRRTGAFLALGVLSILSSEFTAVLFGGVVAAAVIWGLLAERHWNLIALLMLALSGFMTLFYVGWLFPEQIVVSPLAPPPPGSQLASFPYNYVGASVDVYVFPTIGDIYAEVLILGALVIGPLLPFAAIGFMRDWRLVGWTAVLAIGAFSILIWPFAAIPLWHRWLLMLAFPILIFATHGFVSLGRGFRVGFLVLVVVLASTFIVLPSQSAFPYYTHPRTLTYVQSSMLQNTVDLDDSPHVVAVIGRLNEMNADTSVVVAHTTFSGWVRLYLTRMAFYGFSDPSEVNGGDFSDYEHVYLVYWASGKGWFKASLLPDGMREIHTSGNISLYELGSGAPS